MSMSFRLAAQRAVDDVVDPLEFTIDGTEETLLAYPPSEGQLVLLTAAAGSRDVARQAADFMDVFWTLLDSPSAQIIRGRLSDPLDSFALADVMNIIEWLSEEAAARPTEPSSVSTPSRTSTGATSTARARQRASTRSPSPRSGSAT